MKTTIQLMFVVCAFILIENVCADSYVVTLDPSARSESATGRVILFFVAEESWRWPKRKPIDAPFFDNPQPIASIAVENFKPGDSVTIDGSVFAFPDSLDSLDGKFRIQAVLDADQTERWHMEGPGNVISEVVEADVTADANDTVHITLTESIDEPKEREDGDNLKWVKMRSELLSDFYNRDVYHKAGVALPPGYSEAENKNRRWAAIYIIPGFGGREEAATRHASNLEGDEQTQSLPHAVHVVLDPESPLGHHGFVDNDNHGLRGSAFVTELIPHLEERFRLIPRSEARIVTGHSSGGWTSLWLQLNHPDVFGACWSSAPDPIDFTAFEMSDIYQDKSMYVGPDGRDRPSYRRKSILKGTSVVRMTVRQENLMEYAIDPTGRSGQQWDTWEAMFSLHDETTGAPKPMFDPLTGIIDPEVMNHWAKFDMAKLVTENWDHYGPIVTNRVRVVCGTEDSFYLNRAVEAFKQKVEALKGNSSGAGYIELIEGTNHSTVIPAVRPSWRREMREYLKQNGF